jgi:hypothetical protein
VGDLVASVAIEADVHGVGVAEEVVQIPEDLLVGAVEEDAHEVALALAPGMDREHPLDVLDVDEVIDSCRPSHRSDPRWWPSRSAPR